MKSETIQNFTILTDVKSPLNGDLASIPINRFLRILVEGNINEKDAILLNKISSNFEKCSIVIQTELVSDFSFLSVLEKKNHFSINEYTQWKPEFFSLLPDDLEQLSVASLNTKSYSYQHLERFTKLKKLVVDSETKDLSVIKNLKSIEDLHLYQVKGFNLQVLTQLPNLKKLTIKFGDIKDLNPLSNLNKLEHLSLWKLRDIKNLEWIKSMNSLKKLKLGALNKVTEFPNLEHLTDLKYIEIEQLNALEHIDELASLKRLEKLNLVEMNQIPVDSFNVFSNHKNLKALTTGYRSKKKTKHVEALLKLPTVSFEPFYFMKDF